VVFSSIPFLVYFLPVLLLIYFIIPRHFKNLLLIAASVFFYSWGAPQFIFVIIGTTFLDFHLVKAMNNSVTSTTRRNLVIISVSINLGLLFFFKYYNFFASNINELLQSSGLQPFGLLEILLPIGISFYTFETITYVVDVYRRVHAPLNSFKEYFLYIILFPKLIAGPIIRYHEIADQLTGRLQNENSDDKLYGFYRFTLGLCKKVFIANTLALYADMTFNKDASLVNAAEAWIGLFSYSFQIYFDFSGYSDMAIGLGRIFGFRFPENFDNPYNSGSITEFWKRWHITLGNWMRNYLYIPLGGNQKGHTRTFINLWLVFLASGLWHGAAWTFVIWGAYHGALMVLERVYLLKVYARLWKPAAVLLNFLLVGLGWILFRSDTIAQGFHIISQLLSVDYRLAPEYYNTKFICMLIGAIVFSFYGLSRTGNKIQAYFYSRLSSLPSHLAWTCWACLMFTLAVAAVSASAFNPFIYFRF
jgi:alginate O-acetyltransferase complex protein AlgI